MSNTTSTSGTPKRWILYVDGENFAIRGASVAARCGIGLDPGRYYEPGVFLWLPRVPPKVSFINIKGGPILEQRGSQAYYFTSATGSHPVLSGLRSRIRSAGFTPELFKKLKRESKAKGVDVALTARVVADAASDRFEVAVLLAGDDDYVPLVDMVKKEFGKNVYLVFFGHPDGGLGTALKESCDAFFDVTEQLCAIWRAETAQTAPVQMEVLSSASSFVALDLPRGSTKKPKL